MYKINLEVYKYLSIIIFIMTIINIALLDLTYGASIVVLSYKTIVDLILVATFSGLPFLIFLIPLIGCMLILTPFYMEKGKTKLPRAMFIYSIIDIILTIYIIVSNLHYEDSYIFNYITQLIIDIYFIITIYSYLREKKNINKSLLNQKEG